MNTKAQESYTKFINEVSEILGNCTKRRSIRIIGRLKQNMTNGNIEVIAEHIGFNPIAKITI